MGEYKPKQQKISKKSTSSLKETQETIANFRKVVTPTVNPSTTKV